MKKILAFILVLALGMPVILPAETVLAEESNKNSSSVGYFYNNLQNQEQKDLFHAILQSAYESEGLISGNAQVGMEFPVAPGTDAFSWVLDKNFKEISFALTRDHPELFWVDYNDITGFAFDDSGEKIRVYLSPGAGGYYLNGFSGEEQVRQTKTELDAKLAEILLQCQTADRYQTLKRFNQWMIQNNTYNYEAAANRSYELAWSAVSGILSNNDASKGPVCHGYAMAFKLLCDKADIPCIVVEGVGFTSASNSEGHAWNYVQMEDGKWYAVDCTWNDTTAASDTEKFFLAGSNTVTSSVPGKETFGENHVKKETVIYPELSAESYSGEKMIAQVGEQCYKDLQQALDAGSENHPVKLLDSVDVDRTLEVSNTVLLMMDGNYIHNTKDPSLAPVISVKSGASLTILNDRENTSYKGDIRQMGEGTAIENNGKLILRNAMVDRNGSIGSLISGNAYELGPNSLKIAEGSGFLNVGEAEKPVLALETIQAVPEDLTEQTVEKLTEYVNQIDMELSHKWITGANIAQENLKQKAVFTCTDSGELEHGKTYTYHAKVYGYDLSLSVKYPEAEKIPLAGSIAVIGKPEAGQILQADITGISQTNLGKISYQWKRNGQPVAGQTLQSYLVGSEDENCGLSVEVRAENYTGSLESEKVTVIRQEKGYAVNLKLDGADWFYSAASGLKFYQGGKTYAAEAGKSSIELEPGSYDVMMNGSKLGVISNTATMEFYTVTFYDGKAAMSNPAPQIVLSKSKVKQPLAPQKAGYEFKGWKNAQGIRFDFSQKIEGKTSLYAEFRGTLTGKVAVQGTVKNGQILKADISGIKQKELGTITYQWKKNGKAIKGQTGRSYTVKVSDIGSRLSVQVSAKNYNGSLESTQRSCSAQNYRVSFQVNGGEKLKSNQKTVTYQKTFGNLPKAQRNKYEFLGWYTKKSGGTKITEKGKVSIRKNTTYYAHWKKVSVGKANLVQAKNVSAKKISLKLKPVNGAAGYEIFYSTHKNFLGNKTKKITVKTSSKKLISKTISKLSKKKTYYVRVRAYRLDSAGKKIYGSYSRVQKVIVKK